FTLSRSHPPTLSPSHPSPCPLSADLLDHTRSQDASRLHVLSFTKLRMRAGMLPIDLSGKVALVTGVGDNVGFAWHIAKALQAAGARLLFAVHPRLMKIVETILQSDREDDVASRVLPFNSGTLKVEKLLPCDVEHDTMADVPEEKRADKRYSRHGDFSIQGLIEGVKAVSPSLGTWFDVPWRRPRRRPLRRRHVHRQGRLADRRQAARQQRRRRQDPRQLHLRRPLRFPRRPRHRRYRSNDPLRRRRLAAEAR